MMEGAGREDEGGAGAVDFLPDLPGRLAIRIKVLEREGELAIDMAVMLALLGRDRLGRKGVGIIKPGPVQRISAIFRDKHPCCGLKVGATIVEIMLERSEGIEAFVNCHVGRILQAGGTEKIAIVHRQLDLALPDLAIVEEAAEIDA